MGNIFQELQMLSMVDENTVIKDRQSMNEIVKIFKQREAYEEEIQWAANLRKLDVDTLKKADVFMVQPEVPASILPEDLRVEALGFCADKHLRYSGRLVYPVKDVKGDVMGWCGYDKFEDVKYLDSLNNGYKAKVTSVYGMEEMEAYYRSSEPVFFLEGIVCCLYLRQCGLQALATLGSHLSAYVIEIVKRFGMRAVFIPDADEAGNHYRKQIRYVLPKLRVVQSCVAKDVDDSRQIVSDLADDLRGFANPFYTSKYFM